MWWQTSFGGNISDVTVWCNSIGITDLAVYGYLSDSDIDTIQATGLKAWYINTFGISSNLFNWTEYTLAVTTILTSYGYDGVIFDDTQCHWYSAHNNGTTDDLVYYQQFCDNVSAYIVPTMGSNNVIVELASYGDSTDYNDMKSVVISDFIFSYYYEPDPQSKYYNILPPTWTNMSVNAWDIKTHYDNWGLSTYYKYQGWLWLENYWSESSTSTLSIVKTYNSIVDLYGNYTANDLMIYNVQQLLYENRLKNEALLMDIITAWKSHIKIAENKIFLQNFKKYYWLEEWDSPPFNQSTLNSDNWQTWSDSGGNYSLSTVAIGSERYLGITYNGTNDSGWYQYQTLQRRIECSEQAFSIVANVIPVNNTSNKYFILRGIYPYPYAYTIEFAYGATQRILFRFINATTNLESYMYASMNWTSNHSYTLTFSLNETTVSMSISNSSSTWSYTIPSLQVKYNSNRLYSYFIVDEIGDYGADSLNLLSMKINYVRINPLRNYITVNEWRVGDLTATIETSMNLTVYFSQEGMDHKIYSNTYNREINHTDVGSFSFRFNMPYFNEEFTIGYGLTPIFSFVFIMGMVGMASMFGGMMWMIHKIKEHEWEAAVIEGFVIAIVGTSLMIAWLWSF